MATLTRPRTNFRPAEKCERNPHSHGTVQHFRSVLTNNLTALTAGRLNFRTVKVVPCERNTDLNVRIFNRALPCERSLKADLDGTIFACDYRARLAYVMTFDHLHMSYGCRGSNLDDKI